MQVQSLGWKDPLHKGMATHSSILAGSCGQRSLAGSSPWGRKSWTQQRRLSTHTRMQNTNCYGFNPQAKPSALWIW